MSLELFLIVAARREDYVSISVADTGHGIPPECLQRLFNRFAFASSSESSGAGLGTAVSKRLIEARGGQISAQSQVAFGTTITSMTPVAYEGAGYGKTAQAD